MPTKMAYEIAKSLAYAVTQITGTGSIGYDQTLKSLVITEFWHSLNRKGLVKNEDVDVLINHTKEVAKTPLAERYPEQNPTYGYRY